MSRTLFASLLLLLLGVACGGGGTPTTSPRTPLAITVNGRPAAEVTLIPVTFLTMNSNIATLGVSGGPGGSVQWSVASGSSAVLGSTNPSYMMGSPTPPPNGIFVMMAPVVNHILPTGVTTIVARSGNATASIPVYSYGQLDLGCGLRYQPAYSFDPGSVANGSSSDLYITEPPTTGDPFDPCPALGLTSSTTTIHFPYGGVLLSVAADTFPQITATQWSDAQTQAPENDVFNAVLLFKTKGGATVKAMLPVGPVEVTGANGAFPY